VRKKKSRNLEYVKGKKNAKQFSPTMYLCSPMYVSLLMCVRVDGNSAKEKEKLQNRYRKVRKQNEK